MKEKKIYALGFFDGVHLGHQSLLAACCQMAKEQGAIPAALTFDLPPTAVLNGQKPNMINTLAGREQLLKFYGMEQVHIYPATPETLAVSWQDFLSQILTDAAGFICGEDYRFGRNGAGDADKLANFAAQHGIQCSIIPQQSFDGQKISSTRIRSYLEAGELEKANELMGHPHILTGKVVHGQHLGRTIGVPTANLEMPITLLTPAFGVYACKVEMDGQVYMAVTNVGTRPTVNGRNVTVEPWILDYSGDLYGREISLQFYQFLRSERKFDSLQELQQQIQMDTEQTKKYLKVSSN